MPFVYSSEFRGMVLDLIRAGRSVAGLARELEMHESALHRRVAPGPDRAGLGLGHVVV